jgi:hypothetical protein
MGYTHLTDISEFVSPFAFGKTAGTWTPTIASNLVSDVRTAAGADFTVLIPVIQPGSSIGKQGAKLISVDVFYKIETAAATAFAVALQKVTLGAHGVASAGAAVTHTLDADHAAEADRYAAGDHKLTATLSTPAFIAKNSALWLSFVITGAASTVYTNFGAQVNYTLRI